MFGRICLQNGSPQFAISLIRSNTFARSTSLGKKRFRELPVEQDAKKLVKFVCGANYFQEGPEITIKDDSEYPEWIWKMKIDALPSPKDYDLSTKEYWEITELLHVFRTIRLYQNLPKTTMTIETDKMLIEDRILRLRERAIIPEAIDHGYHPTEITEEPINPRVYLKPEASEEEVPLDQLNIPPSFDKKNFYRDMVKSNYMLKTPDDVMYRAKKAPYPYKIPYIKIAKRAL